VDVPGGRIAAQDPQPLGHLVVGEPTQPAVTGRQRGYPLVWDELDCAGTVLPDVTEQRERVAGRYLIGTGPPVEYPFVVRQQPPQERANRAIGVVAPREWHG
jgi:hypothetical protein